MRTPTPLARRLIAALLLVLLTACYDWRPITVSPQELISEEQPSDIRVTSTGGVTFTLENPSMDNDSIAGSTEVGPVRLAAKDFRLLELRRFSVMKTVGITTLYAGVIGAFVALFIKVAPHYSGF